MENQKTRAYVKPALYLVTLALSGFMLSRIIDLKQLKMSFQSFDIRIIFLAIVFLVANNLAGCFRYRSILRTFGQPTGFSVALRATIFGFLGSIFLFQVVGQTLTRWHILKDSGIKITNVALTTMYEKIIAAINIFILGALAALYLYGGVHLQVSNSKAIKLIAFLAIGVVAILGWMALLPRTRQFFIRMAWPTRLQDIVKDSGWVLIVYIFMLSAYTVLVHGVAPNVSILNLAAAGALVMVAASLPISFSGWGVREIGAVLAFEQVGVAHADAVAVSVTVGILSLVVLSVMAGITWLARIGQRKTQILDSGQANHSNVATI